MVEATLLLLAVVTTLLLTGLFIDFARGRGQVRILKDVKPGHAGPSLSIIAAARNEATARALFYGSITYLPLLWIAMIANKL